MGVVCASETSVEFQRNTRHYIPEDSTLHNHRWENLKSYTIPVYERAKSFHVVDRAATVIGINKFRKYVIIIYFRMRHTSTVLVIY
jgi:hypothetical protein